jgi:hypothetical protein
MKLMPSNIVMTTYLSVVIRVFEDGPDNLQHWCYASTTSDLEVQKPTLFSRFGMATPVCLNRKEKEKNQLLKEVKLNLSNMN